MNNTSNNSKIFHDLRSPLNGVLGFNQLIQLSGLTDKIDITKSEHIADTGHALLELIDDIRNQLQIVTYPEIVSSHVQRLNYTFKVLNALGTSFSVRNLNADQKEYLVQIQLSISDLGDRITQFQQHLTP